MRATPNPNETFPLRDPDRRASRAKMVRLDYHPVMPEVGGEVYSSVLPTRSDAVVGDHQEYRGDNVLVEYGAEAKAVAADLNVGDVFQMPDTGYGKT
jgi:hypothetical protein